MHRAVLQSRCVGLTVRAEGRRRAVVQLKKTTK